jgi:acetylornithine deacetylase/succinyl-diaminopimelate desuccinylase family protein
LALEIADILKRIDRKEVIELTQELVRIPSVTGCEGDLAEYIQGRLKAFGLKTEKQNVVERRFNVIGRMDGASSENSLMLHGHMDTVPTFDMEEPYSGKIVGDSIYGRGACDQKGGIAASMIALKAIMESGLKLKKGILFAGVIDEEAEHRGSYHLAKKGPRAQMAVITDQSDLEVEIGCKGSIPIRITTKGKAVHGSTPWLGINAISKMVKTIEVMNQLSLGETKIEGLGNFKTTINIGLIQGGNAYNIVPDKCSIWIDLRVVAGDENQAILKQFKEALRQLKLKDKEFDATMEVARPDWKWATILRRGLKPFLVPQDSAVVVSLSEAIAATGGKLRLSYSNGYVDADFLVNDAGIPSVVYGPGGEGNAHSPKERVKIDQLVQAAKVYAYMAIKEASK